MKIETFFQLHSHNIPSLYLFQASVYCQCFTPPLQTDKRRFHFSDVFMHLGTYTTQYLYIYY